MELSFRVTRLDFVADDVVAAVVLVGVAVHGNDVEHGVVQGFVLEHVHLRARLEHRGVVVDVHHVHNGRHRRVHHAVHVRTRVSRLHDQRNLVHLLVVDVSAHSQLPGNGIDREVGSRAGIGPGRRLPGYPVLDGPVDPRVPVCGGEGVHDVVHRSVLLHGPQHDGVLLECWGVVVLVDDAYRHADVAALGVHGVVVDGLDAERVRGRLLIVHVPDADDVARVAVHVEQAEDVTRHDVVRHSAVVARVPVVGRHLADEGADGGVLRDGEGDVAGVEQRGLVVVVLDLDGDRLESLSGRRAPIAGYHGEHVAALGFVVEHLSRADPPRGWVDGKVLQAARLTLICEKTHKDVCHW